MPDVIEGRVRKYFSVNKDSSYNDHQSLPSAIQETDFISLVIKYDHFHHNNYTNEYFNFELYDKEGQPANEFELNGWKLKFGGPIMDQHWFNQYRTFTFSVATPFENDEFVHVENFFIGIEDFSKSITKLLSINNRLDVPLAKILWEVTSLSEETENLERRREEQYQRSVLLEKELRDCRG